MELWKQLVQGALALRMPQHALLAGRTCGVFLLVVLVHVTFVSVLLWVIAAFVWSDMCAWLRSKVKEVDRDGTDAAMIGGVCVSREQLLALCDGLAAAWLPRVSSIGGVQAQRLVYVALHALIVGGVCQLAVLLSELLVLQLLPALAGQRSTLIALCGCSDESANTREHV